MQSAQRQLDHTRQAPSKPKRSTRMVGNVAYLPNGYVKRQAPRPRAVGFARAKSKRKGLVSTLFVVVVAFVALAVLVSRYAAVCSIGSQNNDMQQQINQTQAKISALQVELELREDIEYVHNTAQQQLGMTYPGQDQKITIDIGN